MPKLPDKKEKNGRNRQQGKIPETESSCIVQPCFALNSTFAPLAVCDSKGMFLFLLNNKPHQAYQKPAVAFCKTNPALHPLLAGLKTAQSFLFLIIQQLGASLPKTYFQVSAELECAMLFPDDQDEIAFQDWKAAHPNRPLLISGIGIMDSHYKTSRLNLDLTLHSLSDVDYSKNFSPLFFEPLQIAIRAYNDAVTMLFEQGFFVLPANFLHACASVIPQMKEPKVKVFDI